MRILFLWGHVILDITTDFFSNPGGRDIIVPNLAQTVGSTGNDTVPRFLHSWQVLCKPLAIPLHSHNDKLPGLVYSFGSKLNEITFLKVRNFKLKLNLRIIVLWNLCLNLTAERTLDFYQESILGDTIWGCSKPRVRAMLN